MVLFSGNFFNWGKRSKNADAVYYILTNESEIPSFVVLKNAQPCTWYRHIQPFVSLMFVLIHVSSTTDYLMIS
jgi:hypothetical protein